MRRQTTPPRRDGPAGHRQEAVRAWCPLHFKRGDEHGRMSSEANTLGWPNDAEAGTPERGCPAWKSHQRYEVAG